MIELIIMEITALNNADENKDFLFGTNNQGEISKCNTKYLKTRQEKHMKNRHEYSLCKKEALLILQYFLSGKGIYRCHTG